MTKEERLIYYKEGYKAGFHAALLAIKPKLEDLYDNTLPGQLEVIKDVIIYKGSDK